ncbi:2-haloacid dehalogenase [Geothermobacter ehrlichii]|uniref:2-haloacid dehalogenase n=1 Tax=Geothermobacter ehrlichii TaxID=213224 RepID=A0A5D3WE79_9BACT|nr:2-haloacid dehalogenase [Geothermobacter ehrlichii]
MKQHADFWQVTEDALGYALEIFNLQDRSLQKQLMEAYLHLDCYEEVPKALEDLKRRGLRTAILSNGSPTMLEAAVKNSGLAGLLDQTLSVEEVGVYKPDPRVYRLAVNRLGLEAGEIAFQSTNAWDVAGAKAFGFRVVWINRFGQARERLPFGPDVEIASMVELEGCLFPHGDGTEK